MFDVATGTIATAPDAAIEKGRKIWACIDALAAYYANVDISKISPTSKFHDGKWDVFGNAAYNFLWDKWLPEQKYYPLTLVCKIVVYFQIHVLNKEVSAIRTGLQSFLTTFKGLLAAKAILTGERERPFQNLVALSSDDVLLVAQTTYSKTGVLCSSAYIGLDCIVRCPQSLFPNTEFLVAGCSAPWLDQKVSYDVWIKKLKRHNEDGYSVRSYPPLAQEVVEAVVQSAVPFVDEYFNLIKTVFDDIELLHQQHLPSKHHRVNPTVRRIVTKKYGAQLNRIFPLKYTDLYGKSVISLRWFTLFEQLIQGAVAWLILLTTGLRNVDMRNLEKGCCQPSKRYDLLNYLVTDIKKTSLENFIIPVPPIVQKAVALVQLAKIDRSGEVLFTKMNSSTTDNTTSDKRKMGCIKEFNNLIKSFALHYDIKLQTISDDYPEATAHCVRATLAGYIGANSHAAIIILKRLFGHSNNLMPDAYLANNPVIIKQRRNNIKKAQDLQAEVMAKAWASGKVTATKGKQLLLGIKHVDRELREELKNESLTEMDFHVRLEQRLKEILLERIRGDDIYALKTPVGVICMRSVSDSTDSPCAKQINHQRRRELNISKDVTDALATLPNPAHCIGKDCPDALMGEPWSRDLLLSFDYYIKLLKGQGHKNLDIVNMARHYVKVYGPLLKDLYETEREEGYFDQ